MKYPVILKTIVFPILGFALLLIVFIGWYFGDYEWASAFANTWTPVLSLLGSALVYYALHEQVKANTIIQEQFEHQQFLRLIDNLNNRISAYSLNDDTNCSGYNVIQHVLKDWKTSLNRQLKIFSIGIMTEFAKDIPEFDFEQFLKVYSDEKFEGKALTNEAKQLKEKLISEEHPAVWLHHKYDINRQFDDIANRQFMDRQDFLKSFAMNNIYRTSLEFRMNIYNLAFVEIRKRYEIILDIYFQGVYAILDYVYNSGQKEVLVKYLENTFTNQEKLLLYQYLMAGSITRLYGQYLLEFKIFNMRLDSDYLITNTTPDDFLREIDGITPLVYQTD